MEIEAQWNARYGERGWRIVYEWAGDIIPRSMALQLYEDGYYEHFRSNPGELEWLLRTASDVYDTAESNVLSWIDYSAQETVKNHVHDIAIRRAVLRHGRSFAGDHLVHVRWTGSEGYRINPGVVPFHRPELIVPGEINDYGGGVWWQPQTIEDFYQRNKVLQSAGKL